MIAVLMYNRPHRRSYDVLLRLKAIGYKSVVTVTLPWKTFDNFVPLYRHRPPIVIDTPVPKFVSNLGYKLVTSTYRNLPKTLANLTPATILLGGARILSKQVTSNYTIINSHPAYLPHNRGLDALKWAIYDGTPIGVTSHIVDEDIDAGYLIHQEMVPIRATDTFYELAMRQYEAEVRLLVSAPGDMAANPMPEGVRTDVSIAHRRMPHRKEVVMMKRFERLLEKCSD